MGWFTRSKKQDIDLDGSIWYLIHTYTGSDGWFHTKTKLSKYLFIIKQNTDYCNHLEWGPSYDYGPVAKNLDEAINKYESQNAIYVKEYRPRGTLQKTCFKTRKEGEYSPQISQEQQIAIDTAIEPYLNVSNISLIEKLMNQYPEYNDRIR